MAYFDDENLVSKLPMMVVVSIINALSIEQNINPMDVRDEDILVVVNWAEGLQDDLTAYWGMPIPSSIQLEMKKLYDVMAGNLLPKVRDGELTFVSGWIAIKNQERLYHYANPDRRI